MRLGLCAFLIACGLSGAAFAQDGAWSTDNFQFASKAEGAAILGTRDAYIARLSPFDRSAKLKTEKDVSEAEFLAFARAQTLDWNDTEKSKILEAVRSIIDPLTKLGVPVTTVSLVKTTGKEEGGAPFTRDSAIVLPVGGLTLEPAKFRLRIAHELFHVISRKHPALRERLYAIIGYAKGDEAALSPKLDRRRITNPDAPTNEYYIRVKVDGDTVCAVPILHGDRDRYSKSRGGTFFDYLEFHYLLTWQGAGNDDYKDPSDPELVDESDLDGFYQQVGRNTNYTFHPEEIMAVNFALLVTGASNVKSPAILDKIAATFRSSDGATPPTAAEICR